MSFTTTPAPTSQKQRSPRIFKENLDPNSSQPESSLFRPASVPSKPLSAKTRCPLPPRPPKSSNNSGNPLKRKLILETLPENGAPTSDSGVQVIVRVRPPSNEEEESEQIVQKISPNSISVLDHTFTFDSVADAASTQLDIYHLVGLPLVENCLAGFNSSIFACGQEQAKHLDKQLNFQCRCSFLEIYNEQITDLLDPTQRNLQIREDVRIGVYVDYLTEEQVCTMKDVTQLLMKGLTIRRTGATSINAESPRSHCVFTCVVESRSKSLADGLSSLRTSRINLVDLAGSERQKLTGAAGDRLKEAGNINCSLSQLGWDDYRFIH